MSLGTRLSLLFTALIVLSVGGAIGFTHWLSRTALDETVESALGASQAVQQFFQRQQLRELELVSELVASDRAFVAYVAQAMAMGDSIDVRSITDLLDELRSLRGFQLAAVLDISGRVVAQSGDLVAPGADLADRSVVGSTMNSLTPSSGLWLNSDQLLMVSVVPLFSGRSVQAFLMTGQQVSQEFADSIASVSQTEVTWFDFDAGRLRPILSTLGRSDSQTLGKRLEADPALRAQLDAGQALDRVELEVAGDRWIVRLQPIGTGPDGVLASMVLRDQLLRNFNAITNVLLLASVLAIVLASILSFLFARRFLRPIEHLTAVAEGATRGEFPTQIRVEGSGEIARLEAAFNRVVADSREQRAIEQFLTQLWQRLPEDPRDDSGAPTLDPKTESVALIEQVPGSRLGERYEVVRCLGQGGMGTVYQVRDLELNEIVALKMLRVDAQTDPRRVDWMKNEIRLSRKITHPNVVRIFDFVQIDGHPVITMEYVRGITLDRAIAVFGCIEFHAGMRLVREICAGVAAAHRVGVIHRDIKPGNVIINFNAKVMDFGIAQPSSGRRDARNKPDAFEGTPHYLAPEQIQGDPVDERADIYALGVLMSEVFTGNLPFRDGTDLEILAAHLRDEPIAPIDFWPAMPPTLNDLILRCLRRDPAERPASVDEVLQTLTEIRNC